MKCQEFQGLIAEFIENTLEEKYYDGFVHHANTCRNCLDELEIYFMIRVGLERMESDASKSFDIQGELKNRLLYYERKADSMFLLGLYRKIILTIAEVCTAILLVLQILIWLGIL